MIEIEILLNEYLLDECKIIMVENNFNKKLDINLLIDNS